MGGVSFGETVGLGSGRKGGRRSVAVCEDFLDDEEEVLLSRGLKS